jgi:hypothetical protein
MEKVKVILAFFSVALLFAIVDVTNATATRTSGVTVGNTFTYGVSWINCSSSPYSTVECPSEYDGLNQTGWFRETVENVVGTNVTISALFHYTNGTEKTQIGWVDVGTGDANLNLSLPLISANLNVGDQIYSGSMYVHYIITETIPMTYTGGSRPTNHIIGTSEDYYWDRATGVLTKWAFANNQTQASGWIYYSLSVELTASSQWAVPEFTGLPLTLLLFALLTVVTLAHTRKPHKTENH